ncbi:MAG: TonB-dependent receptor [Microscillaceae bacterium]|nr:TonB-dependent receptor [Microscillaceae bacterium]
MKLLIYILFFCLWANIVFAQHKVQGKIFDNETKEPTVGATVQLAQNLNIGTTTNAEGYFEFDSPEANPTLKIAMLGYQSQEIQYTGASLAIALQTNAQELQTVVLTANREAALRSETPVAISKLSAKMIDETKATSTFELINKTPGVVMQSLNNEQHGMSIRQPMGTSAYYLYMEDGVPIRPLGVFNHNALLEINQFAISSIEVVKGPVSSIYGPEAVGGAINFVMQRPTAVPSARVGIQFDNWGFRRVQFGAGAKLGKFGFYIGGLSSKQTDSWMSASDYDKTSVNARLEYHFSPRTRLIGNFIYGKYFSQMSGSVDSVAFYNRQYISTSDFTYRKSEASRSRLTLEHDWKNGSKTFVTLFQRSNQHGQNPSYAIRWNPTPSATNDPKKARGEINSNNFTSYGIIAQHSQRFNFLDSKLIVGGVFDYSPNDYWAYQINLNAKLRSDGRSVEQFTIAEERPDLRLANYSAKIHNWATYLQYDFEITKKLRVSMGGRYDRMAFDYDNFINNSAGTREYSQFTPKLGLTYEVAKDKGLYINYSQGFSPPSLTAIFRPRPNTNPVEFYTNLEPAQFQNYEIGTWLAFFQNKLYIDLAFYQMNGTNELLNIRQPDNSFDYQSAGRTLHRGVEFGFTFKPTQEYFFRFGGTNALHRFEDFQISNRQNDVLRNLAGFEMPSAPRWTWNTELYYYPKWLKNFRTSLEWQYVSGWYQNQINTIRYEGYNLVNFRVGYQWKGIEIYSNVMNVANALYANGASRGNNPTDRTTFTPAAPRTLVLGIQYNFAGKK